MDFTTLGIIAILLLINSFTIYRLFIIKQKLNNQTSGEYAQALSALLDGDRKATLEHLKQAAVKDTSNIDAYIHIGDLLRESNEFQSAIKIHKQQTVREGLSDTQVTKINQALALDFMALHQYEKALEHLLLILGINKKNLLALKTQVECYENLEYWLEAFQVTQRIAKLEKKPAPQRLALYKAEACRVHLENQREKEGKTCFKEAIKYDLTCASAYFYLGEYYQQNQRPKEALSVFKDMLRNVPEMAFLPFENLKEILYDLGRFSDIEMLYSEALQKNPDQNAVKFVLAEILLKKGNTREALELHQQILKEHPESCFSLNQSLQSLAKEGKHQAALTLVTEYLNRKIETQKSFICTICDYQNSKPFWHCPQCSNWKSMKYQF